MAQITVPESPKEYATHYRELLGVDYQADQTEVDRRRSPDMVNMISDYGGNPIKRDGYRRVGNNVDALVMIDGRTYSVISESGAVAITHVYMAGYELDGIQVGYKAIDIGSVKRIFTYQKSIYIIGTKCLLAFDTEKQTFKMSGVGTNQMSVGALGESAPTNPDDVPLTVFNLNPNGTGGNTLYDKSLMSIYMKYEYRGDGTATYKIPNYSKMGTWVKAEVKDANGDWQEVTVTLGTATQEIGWAIDGSNNVATSNVVDTTVTFTSAPPAPATGDGSGNVRITFAPYSKEQLELHGGGVTHNRGYYNEHFVNLLSCNAATFQSNRMFVAEKYRVYYSDVSNPFVISDLSWFAIDSEIVGFTRSNNYLAVLTKDTGKSTIYLAQEQTRTVDSDTGETETYYTVKESNSGIGAIAPKCIATLSDEPMFLSRTGVYGILTNWQSEKYAVNRSSRVNRRLCKEPNLETAVGIAFNDYFYLAVNGRMYVLDGRHKESDRAGNKPLEAYVFEGLPAIENMYVADDRMYFSDDTYLYSWSDDLGESERYLDNGHLTDDEEPVFVGTPTRARWCSVFDDDGSPQKLKTLMKKGSMVTLVPHFKSGCEITLVKDGDQFEYLGEFNSSLNTFEYIDFSQFTFNSNTVAFDNFTKKKIKKYKRLQIQVENNKAEPFGLTQITKTYTFGNYAKR